MTKPKATPAPAPLDLDAIREDLKDKGLAAKIAWVQHHISHVEKTGEVKFGNVKFMAMQEHGLIDVARALWRTAGLTVIGGCMEPGSYHREGDMYFIDWSLTVQDVETGNTIIRYYPNVGKDSADKGLNKAMTGANKYAIQKFFQIPTQAIDDNDTVVASDELPTSTIAAEIDRLTSTKPSEWDVTALREMLAEAIKENHITQAWVKNTLTATYGVSKVADLDKAQFTEFATMVAGKFSSPAEG